MIINSCFGSPTVSVYFNHFSIFNFLYLFGDVTEKVREKAQSETCLSKKYLKTKAESKRYLKTKS